MAPSALIAAAVCGFKMKLLFCWQEQSEKEDAESPVEQ